MVLQMSCIKKNECPGDLPKSIPVSNTGDGEESSKSTFNFGTVGKTEFHDHSGGAPGTVVTTGSDTPKTKESENNAANNVQKNFFIQIVSTLCMFGFVKILLR